MFLNSSLRFSLYILIIGTVGCGGGTDSKQLPKTAPASGVVTLNGKPLVFATVTFVPQGATKGIECVGMTDESGKYTLKQVRGGEGVPPGEYRVVINQLATSDGTPVKPGGEVPPITLGAVESLPPIYSSFTNSKLSAKVTDTGGEFPFELKGKGKK